MAGNGEAKRGPRAYRRVMSTLTSVGALQFADISTGIRVPYLQHGDPSGPAVVLLHGYSDSSPSYAPLISHLPSTNYAVAPTQRGHGDGDHPDDGYALADLASDLDAFLDAIGVDEAVVVGHSGGAALAQQFAIDHPGRVRGLVLMGAFRSFQDNPGVAELADEVAQLTDPVDRAFAREFQESTLANPVPAAFLEQAIDESCKLPARVWQATLDGLAEAAVPLPGAITAKTLLVWGELDAFVPRGDQDALLQAIPGSRLAVYPETGHAIHWEHPERVAADIAAFIATL